MPNYTRQYALWKDFADTTTPIAAAKLQGVEDGIVAMSVSLNQRVFNVKDAAYGAVGDGVANDTAALQAALDAAVAGGGGIV